MRYSFTLQAVTFSYRFVIYGLSLKGARIVFKEVPNFTNFNTSSKDPFGSSSYLYPPFLLSPPRYPDGTWGIGNELSGIPKLALLAT